MTDSPPTRIDMHVKVLDADVAARAKARGLDVLVYAPHFTRLSEIRDRAERFSDDDLTVVPAREVFAGTWHDRKHVLAVGLSDPVPDFVTLSGAMTEFERQDAAVLVPHPEFLTVSLGAADVAQYADVVDAVEAHNVKLRRRHNRRARAVARETGLPAFGSSYAHLPGTVGEAWTAFDADIGSEADLVRALRDGAPRRVMCRRGATHCLRGLAEFAHLGYENSWQKVERILLSGTESTHPGHIAYDGRFEDVRVY